MDFTILGLLEIDEKDKVDKLLEFVRKRFEPFYKEVHSGKPIKILMEEQE